MSNVAAFAENGYIAGRSGNRFEPKANITRVEVVKLLDNMIRIISPNLARNWGPILSSSRRLLH
ncbi:MAG: S-layer homology domain-containing protein [Butyricicoccaceae bacterium]